MEAFLKDYSTFTTFLQRSVSSYDIAIDSLSGDSSSVTIAGDDIPADANGSWLIFDGALYFVTQITPGKGVTKLTLGPPDELFNRKMLYDGSTGTNIGAWIAAKITSEWRNQSDAQYATPYVWTSNSDSTAFVAPEVDDDGCFNFLEYIRKARRDYGIYVRGELQNNSIKFVIGNDAKATRPLILDDGHTKLISSSFAASSVAKITVIQPVDTGNVDANGDKIFSQASTNWYLAKDGSISTTVPANRAKGEWIVLTISETDDQAEAVMEEFAKNGESHKIELFSDSEMNVNDKLRINLNGEVFEGTVVGKYRKSGDNRTRYKSGDLITTIQERARSGGSTTTSAPRFYAVGDLFTTTRNGDPATLLGYGAWTKIRTATVGGHSVFDWLRKE